MGRRIGFLGLVNYKDHPKNKNYKVFNFYLEKEAVLFEELLTKKGLWFEKDVTLLEKKEESIYLFGVRQEDFLKAQDANFLVSAEYRKPLIPNKIARWGLVIFFFAILTLAIVGYVKNN